MKAIVLNSILSSFRSRKDRSLGFSCSTGELDTKEKVALMDLEGVNVRMLIEPTDYASDGKIEVKSITDNKTPSQRIRAVLYVWWSQLEKAGKMSGKSFELFYVEQCERILNDIKRQLEPE